MGPTESNSQLLRHIDPGSTVLAVVDMTSGYHQVHVHPDDRHYLTVICQAGRFRYNVLSQGITSASDLFNMMSESEGNSRFGELWRNCLKNMDDILIAGKNMEDLKEKLVTFLTFCRFKNIKLKTSKFLISTSVEFGGCLISKENLSDSVFIEPKQNRIKAFEELKKPTTRKELQVYAGMCSSLQTWFPAIPMVIPEIRRACGGGSTRRLGWNAVMEEEYRIVKEVMKTQLRLSPYNEKEPLCLVIDGASSVGAGYVLFQWRNSEDPTQGASIISANSTMFPRNRGFSPIDGELMDLVFACRSTGYWTSHCPDLHLFSDCSGLLQMLKKHIVDVKNPLHRKLLCEIPSFNFKTVRHVPGKSNKLTDALSRLTRLVSRANFDPLTDNKPIILNMCKRATTRGTLGQLMREDPLVVAMAEAGSLDPDYVQMCNMVEGRFRAADIPQESELKQIEGIREELRVVQMNSGARLLVRGEEVYVPASERAHMVGVLHMGHQSAETMIRNCKGRIFFPGMRKMLNKLHASQSSYCLFNIFLIPGKNI